MLASIFRTPGFDNMADGDIFVFLSDMNEVHSIKKTPLVGQIFNYTDPRNIYPLKIIYDSSNWGRLELNEMDVNRHERYVVHIGREQYRELEETGSIGGRPSANSKIDVMLEEVAGRNRESANDLRRIRNKWEHRDLIAKKLNEDEKGQ